MISEGLWDTETSLCKQQQIYKRFYWRMLRSQMQIKAAQIKRTQHG